MKLRNKILVFILAILTAFSATGCATVKDGNKITKAVMTLNFYKADGTFSTSEVKFELYENNAPNTVAHVKKLINDKFYDGVCISNVTSHFVELGEYYFDGDTLAKKDYSKYEPIKGEFYENGISNQKLASGKGAIVMKHDRTQASADKNKYNTATSGLFFLTNNSADLDKNKYCVIGRIVEDDGDVALTDTSTKVDDKDRSSLSSFGIINSISDYSYKNEDDVSTTTYYQESTGYYFKVVKEGGQTTVYETNKKGETRVLSDSEETKFINDTTETVPATGGYKDEYYDYFKIPYQKIIVESIRIKK